MWSSAFALAATIVPLSASVLVAVFEVITTVLIARVSAVVVSALICLVVIAVVLC